MSNVNLSLVKELREKTSISMSQCIKALGESDNDLDAAIVLLKTWGALKGAEKAGKLALEGKVISIADRDLGIAVILEMNCQTDFNSKSGGFHQFCCDYLRHLQEIGDVSSDRNEKLEAERLALIAKTGENIVVRRFDRFANEGNENVYSAAYTHPGDKLAVIVEFGISRAITVHDADFQAFADDVAMQIAANAPACIRAIELPGAIVSEQEAIFLAQLKAEGKPEASCSKILPGKMGKWRSEIVLFEQPCLKEPKITIDQKRQSLEKTLGCEIMINRFVRYALGETSPKAEEKDLAADVANMLSDDN